MHLPGSTIGILGGGQLGRMLAITAAEMGYHVHIYCPEKNPPAAEVAQAHHMHAYSDMAALDAFAAGADVITLEFENIPLETAMRVAESKPLYPSPKALAICQHRVLEKNALREIGIETAPYAPVCDEATLKEAIATIGCPSILKTSMSGYDGKGQATIHTPGEALDAWKKLHTTDTILEGFVDFEMEISVLVARNAAGNIVTYPPVHNIHKNHILHQTIAPAPIDKKLATKAEVIAREIADHLSLVGLMAVEMFVTPGNGKTQRKRLLVNELAPRPHNSGHWTIDACLISQFEMTIRAVCGIPLPPIGMLSPAVMTNLIGNDIDDWQTYAGEPLTRVHLYGKKEARPGRKMGHVTALKDSSHVKA